MRRLFIALILLLGCRDHPSAPEQNPPAAASEKPASLALAAPAPPSSASAQQATPEPDCSASLPSGPAYHRPLDDDLSPTPEHVAETLAELAERHPCVAKREQLGTSHEGRPIWALRIGNRDGPSVLLDGAHHGDEPLSVGFVLDAARYLLERRGRDEQVDRYLEQLSFTLVPLVNPDGLVIHRDEARRLGRDPGTEDGRSPGRKNARDNDDDERVGPNDGVDLNRNYPFKWGFLGEEGSTSAHALRIYRGPEAGSEPETRALMKLADREVFAASMSFHIGAITILVPYTIDRVRDPEPNEAWAVARQIAQTQAKHPTVLGDAFPVRRKLYAVDGTDQDWHRHTHGTLAYLVEGALRGTAPKQRPAAVKAVRELWLNLVERLLDGPTIVGRVVDAAGAPVAARVHLAGSSLHEGESWRARCRDGRFVRVVTGPGPQRLQVKHGAHTLEQDLEVTGLTEVEIRLPEVAKDPCGTSAPPD